MSSHCLIPGGAFLNEVLSSSLVCVGRGFLIGPGKRREVEGKQRRAKTQMGCAIP